MGGRGKKSGKGQMTKKETGFGAKIKHKGGMGKMEGPHMGMKGAI